MAADLNLALGRGPATAGWLAASTLVRPEGWLHLFLAAAIGASRVRGKRAILSWVAIPAAALATTSLARIAWFGFALPTPLVVKVLASPFAPGGASQALSDAAPLAGALVAATLAVHARSVRWVALAPAAIQVLALLSAGGDWMGHARLILPGLLGSLGVLATMPPAESRPGPTLLAGALALVGATVHPTGDGRFALELRRAPTLEHVVYQYRRGLVTPLPEDVAWAVEHVPEGATILTNDVGFIGGVPGIQVLDLHGLATREVAEAIRAGELDGWLREVLAGPRRPFAVRLAWWGSPPQDPPWLTPPYPTRADLRYPGGTVTWYADASSLTAQAVADRWRALRLQHPQHAWIAWRAAIATGAAEGRAAADSEVLEAQATFPGDPRFEPGTGSTSFSAGSVPLDWVPARGFGLYWDGFLESPAEPCAPSTTLLLDADALPTGPAIVRVSWRPSSTERSRLIPVTGPTSFAAGTLCESGEVGMFRVEFVNDDAGPGGDRNAYARLLPGASPAPGSR